MQYSVCSYFSIPAGRIRNYPDGKLPTLTINKISELPFSNTEWNHVFGGMAEVTFVKGPVTSTDSLEMAKLSAYQKTLELGTYDILLRSKSTAIADSFIRFTAGLKGLVVNTGQALSLPGNTNDGLITIKRESISDNTVPTFTPGQAGAKSYKMGLTDGYYFIYVTAGTTGQVVFDIKGTDDRITKDISVAASNHYNLVVVTNGTSSFGVVLQKFAYREIEVSTGALLKIETPEYMNAGFDYTFVIADDTGRILNSYKYVQGTTIKYVASKEPYLKDRMSVFLLSRDLNNEVKPHIDAYMNVKKGSTWKVPAKPAMRPYYSQLKVSLKYIPAYKMMTFSTDRRGTNSVAFLTSASFTFSEVSKAYFQIENEDQATYNFFDLSKDALSLVIDPALCNIPSASKAINLPAPGTMTVSAKKDKGYNESYFMGSKEFQSGSGIYFYPNETFEEYSTIFRYDSNGMSYADSFQGSAIPQTSSPMSLSLEVSGTQLATFMPTFTGTFDHFKAEFHSGNVKVFVHAPSSSLTGQLSYPDLAAFTGFADFNPLVGSLVVIEAFQYEGFAENQLPYKDWHMYDLKGKALAKWYL